MLGYWFGTPLYTIKECSRCCTLKVCVQLLASSVSHSSTLTLSRRYHISSAPKLLIVRARTNLGDFQDCDGVCWDGLWPFPSHSFLFTGIYCGVLPAVASWGLSAFKCSVSWHFERNVHVILVYFLSSAADNKFGRTLPSCTWKIATKIIPWKTELWK